MKNTTRKNDNFAVKTFAMKGAVKDVDTTTRTVTGFFSSFNYLDYDADVLLPGCAKKSINDRGPLSQATAKIKHCLNHDMTQLPGKIEVLEERSVDGIDGIYFESKLSKSTLGTDTLQNYLDGVYDNHSIGFNYVWDKTALVEVNTPEWDIAMQSIKNPEAAAGKTGIYLVKEIKLWEGSTVAFGANSLTPFLGMAKSMTKESVVNLLHGKLNKLESVMKNGTQSDDMMDSIAIQFMQLKQLLSDLTEHIEIKKVQPTNTEVKPSQTIDLTKLAEKFKL